MTHTNSLEQQTAKIMLKMAKENKELLEKIEKGEIIGECNHFWVKRKDGYEEACGPAICLLCGKYGCYCKFQKEIEILPVGLRDRRKELFEQLGIDGNEHEIEKSLKEKKEDE